MPGSDDPVADFEGAYRKKTRLFGVSFVGVSAFAVGVFGYLVLAFPQAFPPWFIWYAAVEPVLLAFLFLFIRRQFRRMFDLARALGPRLRAAGVPRGSGPTFIFDNGLILIWTQAGPQFYLLGSPAGGKAMPVMEDLGPMRRGILRMRRLLRVGAREGPDALRNGLEDARLQMASKGSWLFVFAPRPTAPVSPTRAAWYATVAFVRSKASFDGDRIRAQVDSIAKLLEEAVEFARAQDAAGRAGK